MGKAAVLIGGVIVISLLLFAVACTSEQMAKPLPNGTSVPAAAAQEPAAAGAPSGKQGPPAPTGPPASTGPPAPVIPTKTNTTVVPVKPVNVTTPAANTTAPAANTAATNSTADGGSSCLDTDYGQNHFVKGSVQYNEGNVSIIKTDDCVGDELREWYCDNGELAKEIIVCPKTCVDGACVS